MSNPIDRLIPIKAEKDKITYVSLSCITVLQDGGRDSTVISTTAFGSVNAYMPLAEVVDLIQQAGGALLTYQDPIGQGGLRRSTTRRTGEGRPQGQCRDLLLPPRRHRGHPVHIHVG